MKAISLHQPYASLIMMGEKRIETRGFPPPPALVGSRIAIHAAKRLNPLAHTTPFAQLIPPKDCPLGAILGSVVIETAYRINTPEIATLVIAKHGSVNDHLLGDYSVGRYAWALVDPVPLRPLPWRGAQRWFEVPL